MAMFFPDVTQIAQTLSEGDELAQGTATEKSYPLDFRRLLRLGRCRYNRHRDD
jgi:hypothetical protein